MKPAFLDSPHRWLNASRIDQNPWEYACAVERYKKPTNWQTKVLVAASLGLLVGTAFLWYVKL